MISETLVWHRSSYSGSGGGDCVEVATSGGAVRVRDSKDADGDRLRFSAEAWAAFLSDAAERGGSLPA
jgi:hypothetical protein